VYIHVLYVIHCVNNLYLMHCILCLCLCFQISGFGDNVNWPALGLANTAVSANSLCLHVNLCYFIIVEDIILFFCEVCYCYLELFVCFWWTALCISYQYHTYNQATLSFGHNPVMVSLPVLAHCTNARRSKCRENFNSF